MEKEIKHRLKRNRRRERAERMQAQRDHGDSAEDETLSGVKPHRPPIRRKKTKEPIFDEDIIDGFAILAFRSYEELEMAVKVAKTKSTKYNLLGDDKIHGQGNFHLINRHSSPALGNDVGTSDDSGRSSEVRPSVLPHGHRESSHDHLSDASSRCSSGRGYICDSEGEDDKNSDAGSLFEAALSSTPKKCEIVESKVVQSNIVMNGVGSSPCSGVLSSSSPTPPVPLLQPNKLTDNSRSSVALSNFSYLDKENDERASKSRIDNIELNTNKKSLLEINYEGFEKRMENNTHIENKKIESNTQQLKTNNIDRILDDQLNFTEKEKSSNRQLEKNTLVDRSYLNSIHLEKSRTDGIPEHISEGSCVPSHLDKRTLNIIPHQIDKCLENSVHTKNIVDKKKDCSLIEKGRLEPDFPKTHNLVSNPLDSVLHNADSVMPHLHNSSVSTNLSNTSHHQAVNFGNGSSLKHLQTNHFYQNSIKTNLYNPVLPSYNGTVLQFPTKKPFMVNTPNILTSTKPSTTPTTSIPPSTSCVTPLISNSTSISPVISLPASTVGIPNNLSTTHSLSNPVTISNPVSGLLQNTALHSVSHMSNQQRSSKESVISPVQGNSLRLSISSNQSISRTLSPSSQHQVLTSNLSASHVGSQVGQDCTSSKISGNPVSVSAASTITDVPVSLSAHSDLPTSSISSHQNHTLQPNTSSSGNLLSRVVTQESSNPGLHSGYSLSMPGTSFTGFSSLYGSYSSNLQHQPYLPPRVEPLASSIASPLSKQQSSLTGSVVSSACTASITSTSTNINNRDVPTTISARRSLSPRGHSPNRERDSYSSNVSSLSRGSTTPVSRAPSASPFNPAASSSLSSTSPYIKNSVWMSTAGPTSVRAPLHPSNFPPPMFAPPIPPPTGPTGPPPFSAESLFQTNQADLLRRELDTRFLASQERSLGVTPAFLRTEMHHHQHQHTHVHQHQAPALYPPPLFKDVPKLGGVDSPFYRGNLGLTNYPGFSPGLMGPGLPSTPFAPPSHLNTFIPKQVGDSSKLRVVKTGKWNAMHVRVAWEIYHHQQKQTVENKSNVAGSGSKETLLRPSGHLFPSTASRLDLAGYTSSFLPPPPHIGTTVSPFGRYPPIGSFSGPPSSFPAISSFPSREIPALPPLSTVHDAWRLRGSSSFPIGPTSWSLKTEPIISERREIEEREREREKERIRREKEEKEKDRERREREEKRKSEIERERKDKERRELERREQEKYLKIRDRSPLKNGDTKDDSLAVKEEDIVVLGRTGPGGSYPPHSYNIGRHTSLRPAPLTPHFTPSSWPPPPGSDPFAYRLDPLLRYNPLVSFRQEEEEQRAKLYGVGGYIPSHASHHQSSSPILLKKEESQSR